jgi:hypothetical protein
MESLLRTALDGGVLSVFSAGNTGAAGSCRTLWPGHRPEALAVGGLDTTNSATPYADTVRNTGSSYGTMSVGGPNTTATVDLMAPYNIQYTLGTGTVGYLGSISGTSFSAPILAGTAATMKSMLHSTGLNSHARAVLGTMLLFADRSNGTTVNGISSSMSAHAGAGRARAHVLSSSYLGAPWGFGHAEPFLANGDTWTVQHEGPGPESSAVTMLRWIVAPLDAFSGDSDFVIELWDTCPSGGGPDLLLASDQTFNQVKRIEVPGALYGGRCLEARIRVFVAPITPVRYISTSVFFSGSSTGWNP